MKKVFCVLIAFSLMVSIYACTETEKVKNERNEYGGKTVMYTLSSGDPYYKKGVSKYIGYYDGNKKAVKKEVFYTDESARKDGYSKSIAYFDSNEREIRRETFPTDEFAQKDGISKSIRYYDENEKMVKEEFFHTEQSSRKSGVSRGIAYYDSNDNLVKIERYGKDGFLQKQ